MCYVQICLAEVQEARSMFPEKKCSEGWRAALWGFQAKGSSLQLSASNKWFSCERKRPFWLTHEHEKLTSCQSKRPRRFSLSDLRWTRWTMILLPVFCARRHVPSVHWWCESLLRSIVCCENEDRLRYWQPHRCNCDQRWHKNSVHLLDGKEWSRHNKHTHTKQKKNLMEHFWFNFNTRLMVFSWTHCCQDVNCFGIFFFLFKT